MDFFIILVDESWVQRGGWMDGGGWKMVNEIWCVDDGGWEANWILGNVSRKPSSAI